MRNTKAGVDALQLPKIITHRNAEPIRGAMGRFAHFQPGPHKCSSECRNAWWHQTVTLEVPTGELLESGLKTLALTGSFRPDVHPEPITARDSFNAQGLEGKVCIRKPLVNALFNLDIIPNGRAQIRL